MNRHQVLVLVGLTLAASAAIFLAGVVWLHRTDGRPTPATRSCAVAADLPQRAPHLSTPAPC